MSTPPSGGSSPENPGRNGDLAGRPPVPHPAPPSTQVEGTGAALRSFTRALRRRLPILLVCLAVVPAAALLWSLQQPEEYEATASLLFRNVELDQSEGSSFSPSSDDPTRAAETNLKLVSKGEIAARTALRLDLPGVTPDAVEDAVSVSLEGESDIASVTAKAEDPDVAARIANAFALEFIKQRREADRRAILAGKTRIEAELNQLSPAETEGLQGERLTRQAEELELLASLQTGNAEIVQRATPNDSPVSPKPLRNAILGLFLGGLLGLALVLLIEQFDTRLKDESEVEEAYGLPILTSLPHSDDVQQPHELDPIGLGPPGAEAFRMLHANLRYFNVGRQIETLLVTSATAKEGKTTVSWGLSVTEARAGKKVLLIEGDMRQPSLAPRLGKTPESGLSLVLAGDDSLESAAVAMDTGPYSSSDLDVLFAGPAPPNPAELMESPAMTELLEEARERYDLVVIDTPPTIVADAIPLMRQASGVLIVARVGYAKQDLAQNLRDLLAHLQALPFGTVANDTPPKTGGYYMPYAAGRANIPT
ncbi:MAG TPA: polysaccharide biosynthesis tyrosine autokinase [Solirubrobacterales bacterium]|nr:polysaccharide biosynthesis tyrosine autokinase [Solirubrobacterales bacterium]